MENYEKMSEIAFEIINYGGIAKSLVYEAILMSQQNEFEKARNLLKEADQNLLHAHKIQTEIIQKEASGEKVNLSALFIHCQDHLMSAVEIRNLSENIIFLNERIYKLEVKNEK